MGSQEEEEVPILSREEAIAEVRRWLDVEKIDPEGIFTSFGDVTYRYKDLIPLLEQDTADSRILILAMSRGRLIRKKTAQDRELLWPMPPGPGEN